MNTELQQSEKILHESMREEAEKVHLEFLQTMHYYFNLREPPKSIPVKLSDKHRRGAALFLGNRTLGSKILIGNNGQRRISDVEEVQIARVSSAHETAHYLHFEFLGKAFRNNLIYRRRDKLNVIARELVAEFGVHLFYRRIGEEIPERTTNTLCQILYPFIDRNRVSLRYPEDNKVGNVFEGIILKNISKQRNLTGILKELKEESWGEEMTKDLIKYGFYI